jgi:hypothetical protein
VLRRLIGPQTHRVDLAEAHAMLLEGDEFILQNGPDQGSRGAFRRGAHGTICAIAVEGRLMVKHGHRYREVPPRAEHTPTPP